MNGNILACWLMTTAQPHCEGKQASTVRVEYWLNKKPVALVEQSTQEGWNPQESISRVVLASLYIPHIFK